MCMVGTPDELIAQIRAAEQAGLKEVVLLPPRDAERRQQRFDQTPLRMGHISGTLPQQG